MDQIKNNERREFLIKSAKLAGISLCGCLLGSILTACDKDGETVSPPPQPKPENYPVLKISDYPALSSVGGILMLVVKYKDNKPANNGNPLIIIRLEQNKFVVLDSICRHAGAMVVLPSSSTGDITCPAHNAKFDSSNGLLKDKGTASGEVPPLIKYNSLYDPIANTLTIAI